MFIFSVCNGALQFDIGVAFKIYHLIVILYLPRLVGYYFKNRSFRYLLKPIQRDYLLMLVLGVLFGFLFKFDDTYESFRLFTQRPEIRSIIYSFRTLIELSSILLIVFWFQKKMINIDYVVKYISLVAFLSILIALIFFISDNAIYRILFPTARIANLSGRFNGLMGEPRAFGRTNAFILLFLLFQNSTRFLRVRKQGILAASLGVLLSMSASAYIVGGVCIIFYSIFKRDKKFVIASILMISMFVFIVNDNYVFQNSTLTKLKIVLLPDKDNNQHESLGKVTEGEPEIFARFEIFDRAALNFFYNNPQYIFFGTGPGLISTFASGYLTRRILNTEIYGSGINTTPATFFISILSRTGLIGLMLWFNFFLIIYKKIFFRRQRFLWLALWVMNAIAASTLFFMYIGIFIAIVLSTNENGLIHYKGKRLQR